MPLFLDQFTRTLKAEQEDEAGTSLEISGASGGDDLAISELGRTAIAHGKQLLVLGYTVDQVVHDYGDLCQAITDLAFLHDVPFEIDEFRTLNRCLDTGIADAVTEFSYQRDLTLEQTKSAEVNARIGALVHEFRNALSTATLAVNAMQLGTIAFDAVPVVSDLPCFALALFISDAQHAAQQDADAKGCRFTVGAVDASLAIRGSGSSCSVRWPTWRGLDVRWSKRRFDLSVPPFRIFYAFENLQPSK